MLRMGFMPSDFHPVVLVLGQAEDLMILADALEKFSQVGGTMHLNDQGLFSSDTKIVVEECEIDSGIKLGLWQSTPGSFDLIWRIPKRYAWIFSNEIADLSTSGEKAGSASLECDVLGEIKVKVSIGEWEDHYLTDDIR